MIADFDRLREAGFTDQQARAIVDAIEHSARGLVTQDHFDLQLKLELTRFKRDILLWVVGVQAPVYGALIYLMVRLGIT